MRKKRVRRCNPFLEREKIAVLRGHADLIAPREGGEAIGAIGVGRRACGGTDFGPKGDGNVGQEACRARGMSSNGITKGG